MLYVTEIFRSIQGESSFAGLPCTFVRLSGCNLRCRYCDTTYAYEQGDGMTIPAIVDRVEELGGLLVEVTGGEPLQQEETPALIRALAERGLTVLLETNGTLPVPRIAGCRVIMDLKCPGSGESGRICRDSVKRLGEGDEVKFVLCDRGDFDWAVETVREFAFASRGITVLFSSVAGRLDPAELADWILQSGVEARLQIQLHKVLWPERDRGV